MWLRCRAASASHKSWNMQFLPSWFGGGWIGLKSVCPYYCSHAAIATTVHFHEWKDKQSYTISRHIGIFAHCKAYAPVYWDEFGAHYELLSVRMVFFFLCFHLVLFFWSVTMLVFFSRSCCRILSACWYCHHRNFPKPNARHSVFFFWQNALLFVHEKLCCTLYSRQALPAINICIKRQHAFLCKTGMICPPRLTYTIYKTAHSWQSHIHCV